ncbi:MAG: thioredoxin family protein, partial [Planctomycetota bacterium]
MDRSFLTDEKVVKASRDFVCIRLATYESKEEAEFMTKLYRRHKSTGLANTTFAFLDPTGKKLLARPGRGPQNAFRRSSSMAEGMTSWATNDYPVSKSKRYSDPSLPLMASFDIGLNVAACDQLLMIAIVSDD